MQYISNLVIFLISLNVLATYASEDIEIGTVKIVTGEYPPYYDASLPDGGPVAMNIMLACKAADLECKIDFLPWNRVNYMLEAGEIDMAFAFAKTEERMEIYVFSKEAVFSPPPFPPPLKGKGNKKGEERWERNPKPSASAAPRGFGATAWWAPRNW